MSVAEKQLGITRREQYKYITIAFSIAVLATLARAMLGLDPCVDLYDNAAGVAFGLFLGQRAATFY